MREGPEALRPRPKVRAGDRRPPATLHDVAREAGVSVATASRALNGSSSRSVRKENVARVLAAAAKLRYEPHLSAQAIARGNTNTAALVVRGIDDPYFSSIAAGVVQRAEADDLIVTMAVADRSPEREYQIVRTLRGQRPRAIIIAGSRGDDTGTREALIEELTAFQIAGGSVVMISQPDLPFGTVAIDNFGGAQQLARALVDLGYQRFAVIRAAEPLRTSQDRFQGFLAGLRSSRLRLNDRHVVEAEFTRSGGYQAAHELVARGLGDTELVFAVNDVMAIGAMTAFRDAGLTPGTEIAVAGFDDIGAASIVTPALTSVAAPLAEIGVTAMTMALDPGSPSDVVSIPTQVVLRNSTPPRP